MTVTFTADLGGWADGVDALRARIVQATEVAANRAALEVVSEAKRHASGRPGPNVITGLHRAHIFATPAVPRGEGVWEATAAPTSPQARRLELGFMNMRDRLGRLYHQPPFPYFRPGLDAAEPKIRQIAMDAWREAMEG